MNWIKGIFTFRGALKFIRDTLIFLVIAAATLELLSLVLSKTKMLPFHQTPRLYLSDGSGGIEWRNENSPWGAWHKINYLDRHVTDCFDVEYKTNEAGARDDPFDKRLPYKKSYVLLGDSFAEGYGVSKEATSESLIENKLGINLLNFGSGGNFGPLQYFLIYEKLASQYPHDGVIVYFLPDNDFEENDYQYWRANGMDTFANRAVRYRPYYKKNGPGDYSYFYPDKAEPTDYFDRPPSGFRSFIADNLWTANVIRTARAVSSSAQQNQIGERKSAAGYFDFTREQQEAALYFVNRLISKIGNKNILLVILPTATDFARIAKGDKPEAQYWHKQFELLQKAHANVEVLDLADYRPPKVKDLYLSCDGHWSPLGHKWAAEIVSGHLSKRFR